MTEIETGGPRRRGRERQAAGPRSRLPEQKAFRQPRMRYEPTKVVSDDELEAIHRASLRVLSDIGIDFLLPEARDLIAKSGGAKITDNRVRFDPAFVEITACGTTLRLALNGTSCCQDVLLFCSCAGVPGWYPFHACLIPSDGPCAYVLDIQV